MPEEFTSKEKWRSVRFINGLLSEAPAASLRLDAFSEELYSDDRSGTPIEDLTPDYSILDQINYTYPLSPRINTWGLLDAYGYQVTVCVVSISTPSGIEAERDECSSLICPTDSADIFWVASGFSFGPEVVGICPSCEGSQ